MMRRGYTALGRAAYALAWPALRLLALRPGEAGASMRERLGDLPAGLPRGLVWIHAASVGEITALAPFLRELASRRRTRIALSVMTLTGRRRAKALFRVPVVQAPLDAPGPARRWLDRAAPKALIVAETELWPVWLGAASARCPVIWLNGRISDRSWRAYRMAAPLMRGFLSRFAGLAVISSVDARRVIRLGARPDRVVVTGNLKVDALAPAAPPRDLPRGRWIVAGSTRPGEERAVLEAYQAVRRRHPDVRLCLAPRHLSRTREVEGLVRAAGLTPARRSSGVLRPGDVLVLDSIGELAAVYRLATVAFVGGTLVPIGGHNVLEPAIAGVPVLFGPHTANVREYAEGLVRAGGGWRVTGAGPMAARLLALFGRPGAARAAGMRARRYVRTRQGAARRAVAFLVRGGWV
jgi:3-deoxy-D-manno-octulosonic-acid transferase